MIRIKAEGFNFALRKVLLGRATSESQRHHHYYDCPLAGGSFPHLVPAEGAEARL
jgi:hypothetical protein